MKTNKPIKPKKRTTIYVDENLWIEFGLICDREGPNVSRSNKIESFIARHVAVHGSGNPQLPLKQFFGDTKKKCFRCEGIFKALIKVEYISGLIKHSCPACVELDTEKGVIKRVIGPV